MNLCLAFLIRVSRRVNAFFCTRLITIVKYKTRSRKFGSTKLIRGETFLLMAVGSNGKYGIQEPRHKKGHLTVRCSGSKITSSTPSGTCNKKVQRRLSSMHEQETWLANSVLILVLVHVAQRAREGSWRTFNDLHLQYSWDFFLPSLSHWLMKFPHEISRDLSWWQSCVKIRAARIKRYKRTHRVSLRHTP